MVFDWPWFQRHQSKLVKLANTSIGRHIFDIKEKGGLVLKLYPSGYNFLEGIDIVKKQGLCKSKIYTDDHTAQCLAKNLKWFWKALHSIDFLFLDHQSLLPSFGFDSYDYYCLTGDGPGFDQEIYLDKNGVSWSTMKAATTADYVDNVDATSLYCGLAGVSTGWDRLHRIGVTFSTQYSGIDTDFVTFASVNMHTSGSGESLTLFWPSGNHGSVVVGLDCADPESSSAQLVVGDWDAFDLTAYSNVLYSSAFPTNDWVEYVLTSAGITGYIQGDHTSQFGIVMLGDQANITPSGYTTALTAHTFDSADYSPYVKPYLKVTYITDLKINIGDSWKLVQDIQINVGDSWKSVIELKINISDAWKTII